MRFPAALEVQGAPELPVDLLGQRLPCSQLILLILKLHLLYLNLVEELLQAKVFLVVDRIK